MWALAKISDGNMDVGKQDSVAHYILLSNAHDGSVAVRVGFTPIRVVCNNTLTLAHDSNASKLLRIRHTSSLHENLELVREIMNIARMNSPLRLNSTVVCRSGISTPEISGVMSG